VLSKGEGKQGIRRVLEEGEWVIILLDVPPFRVKDHVKVSFLGKKILLPGGILSIARDTGAPILPFFSYVLDGRIRGIRFEKPIVRVENEEECAGQCARLIEGWILERPGHWHFWPIVHEFFSS
jgi:lauroyl/myristoyl acyltransferase